MTAAFLRWLGLSLCYLVFAGNLSKPEDVAAALAGAFAAALSLGLRHRGARRLALRGRWSGEAAHTAVQLARDASNVATTLLSALLQGRGHRGEVVMEPESARRPVGSGSGHRALTALLVSLTPDGVALETGEDAIAVHRLSRRPVSRHARPRVR